MRAIFHLWRGVLPQSPASIIYKTPGYDLSLPRVCDFNITFKLILKYTLGTNILVKRDLSYTCSSNVRFVAHMHVYKTVYNVGLRDTLSQLCFELLKLFHPQLKDLTFNKNDQYNWTQ